MNDKQALAKARKLWGKRAYISTSPHALTAEQRAALPPMKDTPKDERWKHFVYRRSVGYIDNVIGAFNVKGQGDTWAEAFAEVERSRAATRAPV